MRGGGERIVRLELDHRPHRHAHGGERILERVKLTEQGRLDPVARLVLWPEIVAERLDDMIGRDAEVRRAAFNHLQHGIQYAEHGAEGSVVTLVEAAQTIEVSEQLVGAVDEMNDHQSGIGRLAINLKAASGVPRRHRRPDRRAFAVQSTYWPTLPATPCRN